MADKFRRSMHSIRNEIKNTQAIKATAFESWKDVALAKVFEIGGNYTIATKPGYIHIHEWGMPESPGIAFAGSVTVRTGDWVKISRHPKEPYEWQVIDIWSGALVPGDYSAYIRHLVPVHGRNHWWPSESDPGADPVRVYRPALQELKCTGDGATLTVTIQPHIYLYSGIRREYGGGQVDLSSSVPGASMIRRTLVYLNVATNALGIVDGIEVLNTGAIPVPIPALPSNCRASAVVELENGQSTIITADDILDSRDWLGNGSSSSTTMPTASEFGQLLFYDDGGYVWGKPVIDETDYSIVIDDEDFSIVYDG